MLRRGDKIKLPKLHPGVKLPVLSVRPSGETSLHGASCRLPPPFSLPPPQTERENRFTLPDDGESRSNLNSDQIWVFSPPGS